MPELMTLASDYGSIASELPDVYTLLFNKGQISLELTIGTEGYSQQVAVNLTNSFDGIALPSYEVSSTAGSYYSPMKSDSHIDLEDSDKQQRDPDEDHDILIDNNLFSEARMRNFVSVSSLQGE
mmetsp:Transcript_10286/g.15679  ORF Transcript_10286/g.15679 Transcript_10286/m.15679 type:complete len:124 (+) Transcript_10286:169-540(+)